MIDTTRHRPLRVSTHGTDSAYIIVPISQLERVQDLLNQNHVHYSVDENAVSLDGKPEVVIIDLGPGSDSARIQAILDANR